MPVNKKALQAASQKIKQALDMSEPARMARAKKMGFDTSKTYYHGTKGDIEAFNPALMGASTNAGSAKQGFFFASEPETASDYSRAAYDASERLERGSIVPSRDIFKIENELEMLKRNDKTELLRAKQQWEESINHIQKVISGEIKEKYPRPTEFLQDKLRHYKNLLDDAKEKLSPMALEARKNRMSFLENQISQYNAAKNFGEENVGANVLPVKLKFKNPLVHDFKGEPYRDKKYGELMAEAKAKGHDAVIFKNTYDPAFIGGVDYNNIEPQDIVAVFEPSQIRSKFAKFDPKKAKSGKIAAGVAGAAALGGAVASEGQAQASEEHPLTQDAASMTREAKLKFLKMFEGGKNAD